MLLFGKIISRRDFVISKTNTVIREQVSVSPEKSWLSGSQLLSNLYEQLRLEQSIS